MCSRYDEVVRLGKTRPKYQGVRNQANGCKGEAVFWILPVHGELPLTRRLAVQTIRGNGFANGNSQG